MSERSVNRIITGLARGLGPLVALAMFVAGLVVLRGQLGGHDIQEVLDHLAHYGPRTLALALGLTVVNFGVLTLYDTLAVPSAGQRLPYARTALASYLNYAFSQALGVPLLTRPPLRMRLYTAWGLTADEAGRVITSAAATLWIGFAASGGLALGIRPGALAGILSVDPWLVRAGAAALLCIPIGYGVWAALSTRPLKIGSRILPRPSAATSVSVVLVGMADWCLSASVLFVLLPAGHGTDWLVFVAIFLVAQVLGLLSMVPAGLGVFEALVLVAMPGRVADDALLASLLAFRLIFYVLPLLIAALTLAAYQVRERRHHFARAADLLGKGVSAAAPLLLSATVFAAGAILLLSGSLPTPAGRLVWLNHFLPLGLIELSHFLGSVVGALLLVVAWGLYRRLDGAYHVTLVLLVVALLASATRGGAVLHVAVLGTVLMALVGTRREFFRKTPLTTEPLSTEWIALVAGVLIAAGSLTLFTHRYVGYSDELWWQFALRGDAPRALRALVGAVGALALFGGIRLLGPLRWRRHRAVNVAGSGARVMDLVGRSPRASAHLARLGDKSIYFGEQDRAFIMYAVEGRAWVSMGDPVGDTTAFPELVWSFRDMVRKEGGRPVFYQVTPAHLSLYLDIGLSLLKVGEEALVPLESFSLEGRARSSLRKGVRKLERQGMTFEVVPADRVGALLPDLRAISDAWLAQKDIREKSFSLGFFSDSYIAGHPVAVVRAGGRPVAFANLWLGEARAELSADLMRYDQQASGGVMDFLFVHLMLWGREQGFGRFNLGMAPLGGLENRPLAPLWHRLGATVFRHGGHFYNFQGLRAYKDKFDPVWEPRYLATRRGWGVPRVLASVAILVGRDPASREESGSGPTEPALG